MSALVIAAATRLIACGGNVNEPDAGANAPGGSASGAAGAGGASQDGGAAGSGGSGGAHAGAGGAAAGGSLGVGGGSSTTGVPGCPASPPLAFEPCSPFVLTCSYNDNGCPRTFVCTHGNGNFWEAETPMPGGSCTTPGKICKYPDSIPSVLVCSDANEWVSTDPPNGTSMVSTTTSSSSFVAVGTGGAGGADGSEGAGGLGCAGDGHGADAGCD
jgi:hypothetical protein